MNEPPKLIAAVKGALRRLWMRSPERNACLKAARIKRGKYECASCKNIVGRKEIQIDHIKPIGKFIDWNTYVERLFCPLANLQAICKGCHSVKTKEEAKKRRK